MRTPILSALREHAPAHGLALPLAAGFPVAVDVIAVVKAIPFARPSADDPWTVLAEWRSLGPAKHYLLGVALGELGIPVRVVHRATHLTAALLATLFGPDRAGLAPVDDVPVVHTYLTVERGGRQVALDVTYPGPWDGALPMPLACGPGADYVVEPGVDPAHLRDGVEMLHCGPRIGFRRPADDLLDRLAEALGTL